MRPNITTFLATLVRGCVIFGWVRRFHRGKLYLKVFQVQLKKEDGTVRILHRRFVGLGYTTRKKHYRFGI